MPAPALAVRSLLWSAALAVLALGPVAARPADASARTYLLGDSVAAWSADVLTKQLSPAGVVLDAVACRGTIYSCVTPGQATRPPSGLATIRARRGRLGATVVLELGYNDRPLAGAIDRVMRELRSQGVRRVAWINLSERRSEYRATNQALSAARAAGPSCGSSTGGPPAPATRPGSSTGCTSPRPGRRRLRAFWRRRSATSREDGARSGRCERSRGRPAERGHHHLSYDRPDAPEVATRGAPCRRHRSRAGHAHGVRPAVQPAPRDDGRGLHAGRDGLVRPGRGDPLAGRRAGRLRPDPRRRVLPAPGGAELPGPLRLRAEHDDGRPAGLPWPARRGRGHHGRLRRRVDRRCGAADPGRDGGPGREARHLADLPAQRAVRAAERLPRPQPVRQPQPGAVPQLDQPPHAPPGRLEHLQRRPPGVVRNRWHPPDRGGDDGAGLVPARAARPVRRRPATSSSTAASSARDDRADDNGRRHHDPTTTAVAATTTT